jgi:hypothetical protein
VQGVSLRKRTKTLRKWWLIKEAQVSYSDRLYVISAEVMFWNLHSKDMGISSLVISFIAKTTNSYLNVQTTHTTTCSTKAVLEQLLKKNYRKTRKLPQKTMTWRKHWDVSCATGKTRTSLWRLSIPRKKWWGLQEQLKELLANRRHLVHLLTRRALTTV